MPRTNYGAEYKTKIILEVLKEESSLEEIAAANSLNPNMVRNWRKEFLEHANEVFDDKKIQREIKRKEQKETKEREQMLKTIGQLTLERDFLQGCFRKIGKPIPQYGNDREEK